MLRNKNISLVLSVLGLHLHSYYRFYIVSKSCVLKWQMKWLKWPIPLPFHILQLVISLPIYIPEASKRYPFRQDLPVEAIIGSITRSLRWPFTSLT